MKFKNKQKGISALFSGIIIILVSVVFMSIIINFVTPYFSTLQDLTKLNNNKNNLLLLNNTINELKNTDIGSYKNIKLDLTDNIIFDSTNNQLLIEQEIKNPQYYSKRKDNQNYGNLNISKKSNNLVFTLDLDDIVQIKEELYLIDGKQEIKLEVTDINTTTNLPIITVHRIDNWHDNNWKQRKIILIDNNKVEEELNDYPLLFNSTISDLSTYAKQDGSDIIFYTPDGTKLYREIEDYNHQTGELIAWIRVPNVYSNRKTILYMYFDNINSNESNATEVWTDDYKVVQHFNEDLNDSTSNANNGTWSGDSNYTKEFTNSIGYSLDLHTENYVIIPQSESTDLTNTDDFTISAIYKGQNVPTAGNVIGIFAKSYRVGIDHYYDGQQIRGGTRSTTTWMIREDNKDINTTHYITYTYDSDGDMTLYVDGIKGTTRTTSDVEDFSTTNDFEIGYQIVGGGPVSGVIKQIDEARLTKSVKSEGWIKTEYNNLSNPSTFYEIMN